MLSLVSNQLLGSGRYCVALCGLCLMDRLRMVVQQILWISEGSHSVHVFILWQQSSFILIDHKFFKAGNCLFILCLHSTSYIEILFNNGIVNEFIKDRLCLWLILMILVAPAILLLLLFVTRLFSSDQSLDKKLLEFGKSFPSS